MRLDGRVQAVTRGVAGAGLGWRSVTPADSGTRAKPGPAGCSARWAALDLDLCLLLEVANLGDAASAGPLRPRNLRAGLCSKSALQGQQTADLFGATLQHAGSTPGQFRFGDRFFQRGKERGDARRPDVAGIRPK